jgi:hypothetical protein
MRLGKIWNLFLKIFKCFFIFLMCWYQKLFLKNNKYYFEAFPSEKYFEKQPLPHFQTPSWSWPTYAKTIIKDIKIQSNNLGYFQMYKPCFYAAINLQSGFCFDTNFWSLCGLECCKCYRWINIFFLLCSNNVNELESKLSNMSSYQSKILFWFMSEFS